MRLRVGRYVKAASARTLVRCRPHAGRNLVVLSGMLPGYQGSPIYRIQRDPLLLLRQETSAKIPNNIEKNRLKFSGRGGDRQSIAGSRYRTFEFNAHLSWQIILDLAFATS